MHVHVCKPENWKDEQTRTKRPVEEGGEDNGAYVYIHIYSNIHGNGNNTTRSGQAPWGQEG